MKRLLIIILLFTMSVVFSCKKKDKFVEPDFVLTKWSKAIQELNYRNYIKCEAYPKMHSVFIEMYRHYYFRDIMVTNIEFPDEEKIEKDPDDNSYIYRNVTFECSEVERKTNTPVRLIRGEVKFIKFKDGKRKKDGWLMSNRSLIRIDR